MKKQYVIVNPRAERGGYLSYDARVPLESIRVGATLKLPVNVFDGTGHEDGRKLITSCVITRIYWDKQLVLTTYKCGKVAMRETYKFVLDEGGAADG